MPLLPVLCSLVAGVLLCSASQSAVWPVVLGVAATVMLFTKAEYYSSLCCTVILGWVVMFISIPEPVSELCRHSDVTYFAIAEVGKDTDGGFKINGSIVGYIDRSDSVSHRLRHTPMQLLIPGASVDVVPGDTVIFKGKYLANRDQPELPQEFNPGYRSNPHVARFRVSRQDLVISGNEGGVARTLYGLRASIGEHIIESGLSEGCVNFLLAALLGESQWISGDDRQLYSRTGMAHILALSGAHVAIILSMLTLILLPLSLAGLHRMRMLSIIALLWCYVVMTGCSASVTRAVIMVTMLLAGSMMRRPYSGMNALCMAAIAILLFTPQALFQAGFQLSFLAVASISMLADRLNPCHKTWLYKPASLIVTPLAATLGTFAVVIYHFHIFPVYFMVAAPIATLTLTWVMIGGMILIMCSVLNIPHGWITTATDKLFSFTQEYLGLTDSIPHSTVEGLFMSPIVATMLCVLPFGVAAYLFYQKRWIIVATLAMMALAMGFQYVTTPTYPETERFMIADYNQVAIAVKQGDKLYFITDADKVQAPLVAQEFMLTHREYMARRGLNNVIRVDDTFTSANLSRKDGMIVIDSVRIMMLGAKQYDNSVPHPISYMVVADGFRGDIMEAVAKIKPETVVFSANLNHRLRKRYSKELDAGGIGHIDLYDTGSIRF